LGSGPASISPAALSSDHVLRLSLAARPSLPPPGGRWAGQAGGSTSVLKPPRAPSRLITHQAMPTFRDIVAAKMTPAQIEEAQRLAREWLEAHP
jgi:hypothetical protein